MYFKKASPESVGIDSKNVLRLIKTLNEHNIPMHSLLLARGDKLFFEGYWKPFCQIENHRMYSQTKSYVGIAVSQLAAEGIINLDDKIIDYFPEYLPEEIHPYLAAQSIENMLNMHTCFTDCPWFNNHRGDRVRYYFSMKPVRYPGTTFYYDSSGSFVLGALVEKVTGKNFLDYLKEKCLNKIGFSSTSKVLTCPGGFAWGDSALLCTTKDMLLFGRLLANKGEWNKEPLLDREAVEKAVAFTVTSQNRGGTKNNEQGYGRQIWRTYDDSFCFLGMHGQFLIYNPKTDILMASTAGFYRGSSATNKEILFSGFFNNIVNTAGDIITESEAYKELTNYTENLKLSVILGENSSSVAKKIDGKIFKAERNPMGITEFKLSFSENLGEFNYTNATGNKTITFGLGKNIPQLFPEKDYSRDIGGVKSPDNQYKCVASGAWVQDNKLKILVQIIDEYIGMAEIKIGFNDKYAVIEMCGDAEDFLDEYNGYLTAE